MNPGWYRMARGWMDHPVFRGEAYSRRDAFQWLIQEAAFKRTDVRIGTGKIALERGQLCHSLRHMAAVFGWPEAKVRRFLKSTQDAKIIDASADAGQTVVTICNYDKYQGRPSEADAASDADVTQATCVSDAKKKEEKKEEEQPHVRERVKRGPYAFEGKTIRINQACFDEWHRTFHSIPDMRAELASLDIWFDAADEKVRNDWFRGTPRMLNNKHQRLLAAGVGAGPAHGAPRAPTPSSQFAATMASSAASIRRLERFEREERERQERGGLL